MEPRFRMSEEAILLEKGIIMEAESHLILIFLSINKVGNA